MTELSFNSKINHQYWDNGVQFFLASLGYCVGLGGLIRFPYLVMKNGGGAFLIPILVMVIIGSPLYYLEILLGQFSGRSPLTVWALCPAFRGLGFSMTAISLIGAYYYMPLTWSAFFLVTSLNSEVPWSGCSNEWNSPQCGMNMSNLTFSNATNTNFTDYSTTVSLNITEIYENRTDAPSPSEEYWNYYILGLGQNGITLGSLGSVRWQLALSHLFCWSFVFICCMKGPLSAGKVVYLTATLPYVLLIALLARGVTLDGSMDGIIYYLKPNFSKLMEPTVWVEAAVQVFYQLGPAWGTMITMASYNRFHHRCYREALLVPIFNFATAFFNGFAIFSVLGFMANRYNVPISKVAKSGPGLAFVAYPAAIAEMPWSPFWAVIFFLTLVCLGIDTQFGMFDAFLSGVFDVFPILRRRQILVTGILSGIAFLTSLPLCTEGGIYLYTLIDWYATTLAFFTICFFECIIICYIYGLDRFYSDVTLMFGSPPNKIFSVVWRFFTPAAMATALVLGILKLQPPSYKFTNYVYSDWAITAGWIVAVVSILPTPIVFIYTVFKTTGATWKEKARLCLSPHNDWVPACPELVDSYRERWYNKASAPPINNNACTVRISDDNESSPFQVSPSNDKESNTAVSTIDGDL